jgi:uncharacterized glyoxalase superfamily protein PhnB
MSADHGVKAIVAIVPTRDMQLSLAFYKAVGFQADLYEDGTQYAFLHLEGNYIHLRLANSSELATNPGGMYIYVQDADRFYAHLLAQGLTPLCPPKNQPWKCREFAISDPDGFLLRIGHTLS